MTLRPSSHDDKISISITLSSLPAARQGFGNVLLLVDQATNTLNGVRMATYRTVTEATAAQTAGYISAATLSIITVMLAQRGGGQSPARVKVGRVNTAGSESWAAAYLACIAHDSDFYGVVLGVHTDTEILAVAAQVETTGEHIVGVQSADADWLTSGLPEDLEALAAYERTVIYYHDTATAYLAAGHMISRLMFDPDVQSAGWQGQVRGVAALATALTDAQKANARENFANLGLPFGTATMFVDPGWSATGRPVYEVVSADWLRARVREDLAALVIAHADRGEKIVLDASGQAKILAVIQARLEQGERVGHFIAGQTSVVAESISAADITNQRLRFTGRGQRATDARLIDFDFEISTDTVNVEA